MPSLNHLNKQRFLLIRNRSLRIEILIFFIIFYSLVCWHFSNLLFNRKNLIYYPQFSKEPDKYRINASELLKNHITPSCTSTQKMVIGVVSQPSEIERREAIRSSWGSNNYVNTTFTKLVFIIGKMNSSHSSAIHKEFRHHKDIVFTEIHENYYNLSLKTFAVFDFAYHQCPDAKCIIKADSDNVLNVGGFESLCRKRKTRNDDQLSDGFIGGDCEVSLKIHREAGSKWHIPYFVYPNDYFPQYCSSGAYAYFGRKAWLSIYQAVFKSHFFQSSNMRHLPEDVLFTGIFANYAGIPRIHIQGFSFYDAPIIECSTENRTMSYSIHLHWIKSSLDEAETINLSTKNFLRFLNHVCSARIN